MPFPMLAPVVGLILWSFVMWLWLYIARIPAMKKAQVRLDPNQPPGWLERALPPKVQWKADNYNHLMEQPTLFYAVTIAFAVTGMCRELDVALAWAYVGLRVVHSVVQATVNVIILRFTVFVVASLMLLALALRLAMVVFGI